MAVKSSVVNAFSDDSVTWDALKEYVTQDPDAAVAALASAFSGLSASSSASFKSAVAALATEAGAATTTANNLGAQAVALNKTAASLGSTAEETDVVTASLAATAASMQDTIGAMETANAAYLSGKIPNDVSAMVRQAASETSKKYGLYGQGAVALTARDLGLTSLQIQQQGLTTAATIAGLKSNVATVQGAMGTSIANKAGILSSKASAEAQAASAYSEQYSAQLASKTLRGTLLTGVATLAQNAQDATASWLTSLASYSTAVRTSNLSGLSLESESARAQASLNATVNAQLITMLNNWQILDLEWAKEGKDAVALDQTNFNFLTELAGTT